MVVTAAALAIAAALVAWLVCFAEDMARRYRRPDDDSAHPPAEPANWPPRRPGRTRTGPRPGRPPR